MVNTRIRLHQLCGRKLGNMVRPHGAAMAASCRASARVALDARSLYSTALALALYIYIYLYINIYVIIRYGTMRHDTVWYDAMESWLLCGLLDRRP